MPDSVKPRDPGNQTKRFILQSPGQAALLTAWQSSVDELTELELDPDEPIPYRPIPVEAETAVALERRGRDSDRKAAATYIKGIEEELRLALEQRDAALCFILGDPARAKAWVLRGGK